MSLRKRCCALLLLLAALLCACSSVPSAQAYSLTVWYASDGDPLAPCLERLAETYNAAREKGSLPVTLRGFADEDALVRALENGAVPDLLLCSHALAFTLYERGLLRDPGVAVEGYPVWLTERSGSVGRGYYPLGFDLPLLCAPEGTDTTLPALLDEASAFGRATGRPSCGVDAFAPLFYQTLLDAGVEFTADPDRDLFEISYVNLYNALTAAVFDRGLTADTEQQLPCRLERASALRGRDLTGCALHPLSTGALLAEGRGLAVTSREPRSQRDLPRFLRWLLTPERLSAAALEAGLVPAVPHGAKGSDPLETALIELCGRELHLPDGESQYYVNHSAFESAFRAALELLH